MYVSVCICDKKANDLAEQCIYALTLFASSLSLLIFERRKKNTVETKTSDERKRNASMGNHTERNAKKSVMPKEMRIESNNPSGFLLQTGRVFISFWLCLAFF